MSTEMEDRHSLKPFLNNKVTVKGTIKKFGVSNPINRTYRSMRTASTTVLLSNVQIIKGKRVIRYDHIWLQLSRKQKSLILYVGDEISCIGTVFKYTKSDNHKPGKFKTSYGVKDIHQFKIDKCTTDENAYSILDFQKDRIV